MLLVNHITILSNKSHSKTLHSSTIDILNQTLQKEAAAKDDTSKTTSIPSHVAVDIIRQFIRKSLTTEENNLRTQYLSQTRPDLQLDSLSVNSLHISLPRQNYTKPPLTRRLPKLKNLQTDRERSDACQSL